MRLSGDDPLDLRPRPLVRRWRITVEYLTDEQVLGTDTTEAIECEVTAPTAQAALRQLVLTSTENARVTRVHVERVSSRP